MNFGENTCLVCSKRQCFYPQNRIEIGFPGGPDGKESACSAGDPGSIPGSERSSGEGNDNPLQYSWLGNPMDRGAWWAIQSIGSPGVGQN